MNESREDLAWLRCNLEDLWIFDKLILARKLGYVCGPIGVDVPCEGEYVVRPCVNIMGMGLGARIEYIKDTTDYINLPGGFWSEKFEGEHLSVDYHFGKQDLCVKGTPARGSLNKWTKWEKVDRKVPRPGILSELKGNYEWINIEIIGSKVIEVHLRRNPDFLNHNSDYVIPVWSEAEYELEEDQEFIESEDGDRVGFIIEKSLD